MNENIILIVEDNREISDMLSAFLTENGYQTECAYNGREAALCLKNKEYTLILMDLMLPYRSGNDLIKELRTRSNVPVICLSAKSGMETRLEVLLRLKFHDKSWHIKISILTTKSTILLFFHIYNSENLSVLCFSFSIFMFQSLRKPS